MESQAEGRTGGGGNHEGNKQDTAGKYFACTRSRTFPGQEEHSGTVMLNSVWEVQQKPVWGQLHRNTVNTKIHFLHSLTRAS